ncbi:SusC/RagA family TonB-linked outer membrane protein [Empedobacter sp. UBA7494]|uniref:SusC/RagA family TonB-linked outer membrane protein n=1 Tax=Empedobacter sp. UBA7494 TaxID=1946450 RepID=UPI0025C2B077|nr:SusC/RagA family TonB-linked outer membrane protein [Empedobacter sp. UBA7494]
MRRRLTSLGLLAFLGLGTIAFAQVTGVVNDGNNFPESDVEVTVKGTDKVAYTDENGNFNIDAKVGDTLIINGKEFKVTSTNLGALKYSTEEKVDLGEVVVVAFGKQRKEAITGAVSVVDEKILEKQQATNVISAIQGSVAGVNIINSGGQPGSNPSIRIRGISSVNASADPLIVLDGVPFNGSLSMISQDMIESINVLKDAGSTALYGARGANGVILIETKKGRKSSEPRISFMSQFGVADQAVKMHKRIGAEQYMKYAWESLKNGSKKGDLAGQDASDKLIGFLGYNPYGTIDKPIDANGNLVSGAKLLWDTDWESLIQNKSASRREYSLNVDGGNENTTYNFGASYLNQEGSVIKSRFERTTIKANVITKANDWLEIGANVLAGFGNENGPTQSGSSFQSPIQWINSVSNIYPAYKRNSNGELIYSELGELMYDYGQDPSQLVNGNRPLMANENAYAALLETYKINNKRTNINVNGFAKINFNENLSLRSTLGYQSYLYDNSEWSSNEYGNAASIGGRITKNRDTQVTKNITNILNYNKTFGDHTLSIDAIMDMYDFTYETTGAQGTGFLPGITVIGGTTIPERVNGAIYRERNLAYMGRLTYDYMSKYFVEGSYRKEASSRFSRDERWGQFYSVGASWIISKEEFLKGSSTISLLKLRGSYGEVGNNRVLSGASQNYFPYLQGYEGGFPQLDVPGLFLGNLVDANLTWEKTASLNVGLDFGFLKNRISGSVDYFNRKSIDLIMGRAVPPSAAGQQSIVTNIGTMKNYGFEINLNTKNIVSENFEWNTNINVGRTYNEIIKLNGADQIVDGTKLLKVGGSRYDWYLREYAGVDSQTGDAMWYKDDGNGNKVTTKVYGEATRYLQDKSALPDFEGGISNYFRYKNFDLNVLFNFSVGSYVYDSSYAGLMHSVSSRNAGYQLSEDINGRWQNPGDITDIPKLTSVNNDYTATSTRFLFKNDYLRLKALNFGYNFSERNVQQMGIKGLRIYFQGDNLLTFQSHKGIDPEQSVNGVTDSRSYQQRIYTVGFSVKL